MSGWGVMMKDNRWWFVDPLGRRGLSLGVNSVDTPDSWTGTSIGWRSEAADVMTEAGLNTTGAFGSTLSGFSSTPTLGLLGSFTEHKGQKPKNPRQLLLVDDPEFESWCEARATERCTPGNAQTRGYFLDNELNWNSSLPSFQGLVRRYFRVASRAVNDVDPGTLLLGCRFHPGDPRGAFRGCGDYCDVVSVNYYGVDKPGLVTTAKWFSWSGKPYMVSEMYAMAGRGVLDGLSVTNAHGAGKVVRNQPDRAMFYDGFARRAFEDPNCVGVHWFRMCDDPSQGGANKGLVGIKGSRYTTLIGQMAATNSRAPR